MLGNRKGSHAVLCCILLYYVVVTVSPGVKIYFITEYLLFSTRFAMSNPSSPSHLRLLFETALQEYEKLTGTKLADHPLATQLETCGSVESITAVLQERAQAFREFRGGDGKVMKPLKCAVNIMHTLSISTVLGESIGLARWRRFPGVARFLTPIQ